MNQKCFFKMRFHNDRGIVLIGVIGVMIFGGLFTAIGTSIVTSSSTSHNNLIQGAQASSIANAGTDWYLEQLSTDTDWTNEANQTKSFAEGSFTISISSASATEVAFTSTGNVTSTLGNVTIARNVSLTALKLPPAFRFAVFQGMDPGSNFDLIDSSGSSTTVTGDIWSRGSVDIDSPNIAQGGKVYVPDNEAVTGSGTYTAKLISTPYPSMPVITATYYTDLITSYDALLDANTSTSDTTVSSGTFTVSGTMEYRDFETNGNVTITGNGTVVANRNMDLHGANGLGSTTTLTITPSVGGSITFLANRNLTIGSNNDNPTITINSGCNFYSAAATSTGQLIRVRGNKTTINGGLLLAQRRIIVEEGANVIADSTLFVNYPGSNTSNMIEIDGDNNITTVDGSLISLSRNNPGIQIHNGSNDQDELIITGLIYAYGSATTGYCEIDQATIRGSVVCTRFVSNEIRRATVTYDLSYFPSTPPRGFEGFAMSEKNSWDGV